MRIFKKVLLNNFVRILVMIPQVSLNVLISDSILIFFYIFFILVQESNIMKS